MAQAGKREENNSSNNVRKFILKAPQHFFFRSKPFSSLVFFLFPSEKPSLLNTALRQGSESTSLSFSLSRLLMNASSVRKIICACDGSGKINSTCFVPVQQWVFEFFLVHSSSVAAFFLLSFAFCSFGVFLSLPSRLPTASHVIFRIPNPHHVSGTLFAFQMERKKTF